MKQPEDSRTIDMLTPAKRGRGRPTTGHAMSDAERAKKYRAEKKSLGYATRTIPAGAESAINQLPGLELEHAALQRDLANWIELASIKDREIESLLKQIVQLKRKSENLRSRLKSADTLIEEYKSVLQANTSRKNAKTKPA